eukprot:2679277-Amphidinium_carterae.1
MHRAGAPSHPPPIAHIDVLCCAKLGNQVNQMLANEHSFSRSLVLAERYQSRAKQTPGKDLLGMRHANFGHDTLLEVPL